MKTPKPLNVSILALLALACFPVVPPPTAQIPPRVTGENDVLDPAFAQDFGAKDVLRIRGSIARAVARSVPYVDILGGGTIEANLSTQVRSVVQEEAVIGNGSLVRPAFVPIAQICGTTGGSAKVGSKEYTYQLEGLRDKGPLVCVKVAYPAFRKSYEAAEDSLKKGFVKYNNNDVKITLTDRAGCKAVIKTGYNFEVLFAGEIQGIDTALPDIGLPNAMLNFKTLSRIGKTMREDLAVMPWENSGGTGEVLKLMGSHDLLDFLRDEAGVKTDHQYMAAGSYKVGQDSLRKYMWEGPYRGVAFGYDWQPLRFNELDDDGNPDYIEPEIAVETSNGWASRPNPAWLHANYETALLSGMESFNRLVPEKFTGEGGFRWPAQLVNGELKFMVIQDNENNAWQDYGRHFFQLERAYEPVRPHAICSIHYKRVRADLGLSMVNNYDDGLLSI